MKLIINQMLGFILLAALASASSEELEMSRETLSEEECKTVVKKVMDSNRYTEDAILPICKETAGSSKCDFFSEALSLASSHPDFSPVVFCKDIAEAHFCSKTMDVLLSSPAVADLMLGECMRRSKDDDDKEPKPHSAGIERCLKLQKLLSYAIHNDDLDTMRTCYMIQAYGDLEGPKDGKNESTVPAPSDRIVASSGKKIDDLGEGEAVNRSLSPARDPPGQAGIVLKPVPLDSLGKGKAIERNKTEAEATNKSGIVMKPQPLDSLGEGKATKQEAAPAEAEPAATNETTPEEKPTIVAEPLERQELAITKVNETDAAPANTEDKKAIVVDALPRQELAISKVMNETEAEPPSPIIVEPIPQKPNETPAALVAGRKPLATSKTTVVALLAKTRPVTRHT